MKNRLITIVLTVAILLSNVNSVIHAKTNVNVNVNLNTEKTSTTPYSDMKMGYHGEVEVSATPLVEKEDEIRNYKASSSDDIPAGYRSGNLPSMRNQDPYNTCGAVSATA